MNKILPYFLLFILAGCSSDKPVEKPVVIIKRSLPEKVEKAVESKVEKHFSATERYMMESGLVNVQEMDSTIQVKLIYNDTCNFLHYKIYDSLSIAFLPRDIATKLCNAQKYLKELNASLSLIIFDAARPHHIQKLIWDSLKMEPNIKFNYVATPWDISLHNYGAAVDVTIKDMRKNELLNMGTIIDHFGQIAAPLHEMRFLKNKQLSDTAYKNRVLLRTVMKKGGFTPINTEWWHFNSCNKEFAAQTYTLLK
ncbi:MAG: M15 family metallopeptidase [Bacteroidia bacterium]|nr:M15 family metallopeptidase [Bacteroidia bacterium]